MSKFKTFVENHEYVYAWIIKLMDNWCSEEDLAVFSDYLKENNNDLLAALVDNYIRRVTDRQLLLKAKNEYFNGIKTQRVIVEIDDGGNKEKLYRQVHVVQISNKLNQARKAAFDGVYWYYQPNKRSPFVIVSANDIEDKYKIAMFYFLLTRRVN